MSARYRRSNDFHADMWIAEAAGGLHRQLTEVAMLMLDSNRVADSFAGHFRWRVQVCNLAHSYHGTFTTMLESSDLMILSPDHQRWAVSIAERRRQSVVIRTWQV
ncbi:hypothetical protein IG631_17046 [Alternaria alternata]|nr:hypothetical protein IG631_17046 [Alternaria alternata]